MLMTIAVADRFKLANHYTDNTATYVSSLETNTVATKKGIATDTFSFSLATSVFDYLNESFFYICYDTVIKIYIDDLLVISGYVEKIQTTTNNTIKISISSIMKWQYQQFLSPAIESLCQNQVYSENCTLSKDDYNYQFTTVDINCFTGEVPLTIDETNNQITLGGNISSIGNILFLDRVMWWNAIIIINGLYRTTVVNVTDEAIYLGINYLDLNLTTVSLTVYLKCDKTYGQCFARFANTKNFWGFANTGAKVQTIDIFSAENLTFCGDDLQDQDFEECNIDYSLYGVDLR